MRFTYHMKWLLLVALSFLYGTTSSAVSEPKVTEVKEQENVAPIRIISDRLKSDHEMRWVEFIGSVKATQEDVIITADRLKIFYKPGADTLDGTSTIETIVSEGNVRIVFDNKTKTAAAGKAIYSADEKVLVLSEGEPTVWSGKNIIQGKKITLFQSENRTLVEGGEDQRVEATFYTKDEGGLIK